MKSIGLKSTRFHTPLVTNPDRLSSLRLDLHGHKTHYFKLFKVAAIGSLEFCFPFIEMVYCGRCCLHNSMRGLNFFVNVFGVGVIIYTLSLLSLWCLNHGVGIAVCFSTLYSYLVAHYITNSTLLLICIVSILSLLCVEVTGVVAIFYRMNWAARVLAEYIDDTRLRKFMIFHLYMCRLIALIILIPQIKCTVLAIILWAIGTEPLTHCDYSDHATDFRYSFLVIPSPTSLLALSRNGFRHYEALPTSDQYEYPPRLSFFSHINRFFRRGFHRRVTLRI